MPGESDNNERILYTSESVGEGHPGKYQKYFLLEILKYFKFSWKIFHYLQHWDWVQESPVWQGVKC